MEKRVLLTMEENKRLMVLQEVMAGERTLVEAAGMLGVSERHGRRLLARVREKGAPGVAHGNRGRRSSRKISSTCREKVVRLRQTVYWGFNDRHFAQELQDREGIDLSRESIRRLLREAGIPSVQPVKKRRHRLRRKPQERFGELLQGDSSPHDWLEGRGPRMDLVHFVDDATGIEWADFFEAETTLAYLAVMMGILRKEGIPRSRYLDKHSVFRVNREATAAEQLAGSRPLTTFGRAMEELGIRLLYADSPQAKGRVERRGGLNQDRLVSELRKVKARTLAEARVVLTAHLCKNNTRFKKPPAQPASAFLPVPEGLDLHQVLCWKEERTVANDNTIAFQGRSYQIPKSGVRATWAKCKVAVHLCLDGSLHVFHKRERIAYFQHTGVHWNKLSISPTTTEALRAHSPNRTFSPGH